MARDEGRRLASRRARRPRILSVIGTRPEAIKMAPVIGALRERGGSDHRLALTGQHTEMVDQVLDVFGLEVVAGL
ncbi:MAG: hypothetical protein OXI83_10290, partial [Gemmatimonadota bacterium]|nr:hypothetical protein [Gemmatimonadota bacterium]